jgi:succinate dehydrogenase/fumarate reductase iron-sulfur protein
MSIRISIRRYDPDKGGEPVWVDYEVPAGKGTTVLESLMHIYESQDPTLAFRFGCRFDKCGLCAVEVNGRPRMGCYTEVKDGMRIGPLAGMPVVRDLVIDRTAFFEALRELELFIPEQGEAREPRVMQQSEEHKKLLSCVECLACNATCSDYDFEKNPFIGPYVFVKMAQLHLDPRNEIDRKKQALGLGLGACTECRKCYCIHGINIRKQAVQLLAGN